jgi:hypothetical protein
VPRLPTNWLTCDCCGADLKPIYVPERALILYFGISMSVVLTITVASRVLLHYLFVLVCFADFVLIIGMCFANRAFVQRMVLRNDPVTTQFSLMQSLHAMLFIAVLYALLFRPLDEHVNAALAAAWLGGIFEMARYVSIKRAQRL